MADSNIRNIAQFAFEENKKIRELDVTNNLLVEIPRLFKSTENELQILSCSNNNLQSLNTVELSNLEHLTLSRNKITDSELTSILETTPNISYLDVSSNNIQTISTSTFQNQRKLQYLDLKENQITYIQPSAFDHISDHGLFFIILSGNKNLQRYISESQIFCDKIQAKVISIYKDTGLKINKDLKVMNEDIVKD